MKKIIHDKSSGAIIFRVKDKSLEFLLLKNVLDVWEFPKGHFQNSNIEKSAIIEVNEETGLDISEFSHKFMTTYEYIHEFPKEIVQKKVYLFLHNATTDIVMSSEHKEFCWFSQTDALTTLQFKEQRKSLNDAIAHIQVKNPF